MEIFNKIKTPEDLLCLSNCEILYDIPNEILKNLILLIERIMNAYPINYPENIINILAQSLSYSSKRMPEIHKKVYQSLENKISKDFLIPIYSLILFKQYDISKEYKNHVIDYIKNNSGKNPLSIWYLLNTIDIEDKSKRFEFLMNNLKDEYGVKAEDFIECLTKKNEKILLFQYLRITKCFYLNCGEFDLTETYFYKNSVKSIENIFNLKYKDALYIYKNIYSFPDIFKYFTPVEKNKQEQESIIFDIVIITTRMRKCREALSKETMLIF
jgi:hypothetical protein